MAGTEFRARDWAVVLVLALAFKQGYSLAETSQLQWLLRPLALLLNQVGLAFQPLASGEWLDADHGLVIVKACAGGNFLIASWLGWLWRGRDRRFGLALAAKAFAAAWFTTLVANSLRILLIAHGQDALAQATGLSDADSHRLIGIGVYFGGLCVQMAGTGAVLAATLLYLGVALLLPALRALALGHDAIDPAHVLWTAGMPLATLALYQAWRRRRPVPYPFGTTP